MCEVETVSDGNFLNLFCNVECTPHESCAWFAQCCLLLWLRATNYTLILKEYSVDTGVMIWLYSASEIITGICVRYNNSSVPNVAYMFQWIWSASVQIMAWRLFGAKPFSKSILDDCQLDHSEQISMIFQSKDKSCHSRKHWKYRLSNSGQGGMS